MILKISELDSGFKKKIFDIPTDVLPERGTIFKDKVIKCVFTVKKIQSGFKLFGDIDTKIEIQCIKCLQIMDLPSNIPANIIISNNIDNINDNQELIALKSNTEQIDIGNAIADIIELSKPSYPICYDNCKGLCTVCGINKNEKSCTCKIQKDITVWDNLKNII